MKALVAYYSWTGKTAEIAKAIAAELGADLEPIREPKPRRGLFSFLRSALEARGNKAAPILPLSKRAADYDVVVLGSPVWAGRMASPMRAYIEREGVNLKQVAFFCTLGGANGDQALADLRAACGLDPRAELLVEARALATGIWRARVGAFARKVALAFAAPAAA